MASSALLDIQRAVRAWLVAHDDAGISPHIVASGLRPAERLEVYRNTCASVLVNALRLSYPAVHKLVGAEFFEGAARLFIAGHPPASACLDDYGDAFPEFLGGFGPATSLPYLPEVARLEFAVCRALHAQDAEALDARCLARVAQAERVRFVPHLSVTLLEATQPADLIWRAVLNGDDAALAAIDLASGTVRLLVERRASGVEVARLSEPEWRFAAALFAGTPLHDAIGECPDFDAARALAAHLSAGRFVAFRVSA
jgi:hypothetical protein